MKAITFADDKFMPFAVEQADNMRQFGIEHEIIRLPPQTYGTDLWVLLTDETIKAIKRHGKIMRLDAEVRLLKPMPDRWHQASNVLFFINPMITHPWYTPVNSGQIILDESAIGFLEALKTLTMALIPPGHDGTMPLGQFDDEDMINPALAITKMEYLKEVIEYDRRDDSEAACTRGEWFTPHTILKHGFMHNWNIGAHFNNRHPYMIIRNNFCPDQSVALADAVIFGLRRKNDSSSYWKNLGFDANMHRDGWYVDPAAGTFWHVDHPNPKLIDQ